MFMNSALGCNVNLPLTDVSLNVFLWMMSLLDDVSLGQCVPDQSIPNWGEEGEGGG
jgi:hypothetical protein